MATRRRSRSRQAHRGAPGWLWMLAGLSIGLVVAAAIYFSDERAPVESAASVTQPTTEPPAATVTAPRAGPPPQADAEPHPATRFDFYDMLPQFEVVIPEAEPGVAAERAATAVAQAGNYVIQAGSFRALADADRMQATLALLGIESRIQRVPIDDDIYHRVRIGPINDLGELNRVRRRLWDADIEVLLLRVPN